jgi:hypothetical protein
MMSVDPQKDVLAHAGVMGMHWGVHKRESGGSKAPSSTAHSPEHTAVVAIRKKKLSELSNDEIKVLAERVRLENDYKALTQTKADRRKKMVMDILATSLKGTVTKLAQQGTDYAAKKMTDAIVAQVAKNSAKAVVAAVVTP